MDDPSSLIVNPVGINIRVERLVDLGFDCVRFKMLKYQRQSSLSCFVVWWRRRGQGVAVLSWRVIRGTHDGWCRIWVGVGHFKGYLWVQVPMLRHGWRFLPCVYGKSQGYLKDTYSANLSWKGAIYSYQFRVEIFQKFQRKQPRILSRNSGVLKRKADY